MPALVSRNGFIAGDMTPTHVVLATQSSVYVWNYRDPDDDMGILGSLPGMDMSALKLAKQDQKKKEGVEGGEG